MIPLLAQVAGAADGGLNTYVVIGLVVVGLGSLSSLAVSLLTISRLSSGKANERQIEPTQLAALQQTFDRYHQENKKELHAQTATLNKLDREMGIAGANIAAVDRKVEQLAADTKRETENVFKRINAISTESSVTSRRLDDHIRDHREEKS